LVKEFSGLSDKEISKMSESELKPIAKQIFDEIKPLKEDLSERKDEKKKYKDGIFGVKMSVLEKITWASIGFLFFNLNHIIKFLLNKLHYDN